VARSLGVSRDGKNVGVRTGTVGGVVSGLLLWPEILRLEDVLEELTCQNRSWRAGVANLPEKHAHELDHAKFNVAFPWVCEALAILQMVSLVLCFFRLGNGLCWI
jgi:hypothetical protein